MRPRSRFTSTGRTSRAWAAAPDATTTDLEPGHRATALLRRSGRRDLNPGPRAPKVEGGGCRLLHAVTNFLQILSFGRARVEGVRRRSSVNPFHTAFHTPP